MHRWIPPKKKEGYHGRRSVEAYLPGRIEYLVSLTRFEAQGKEDLTLRCQPTVPSFLDPIDGEKREPGHTSKFRFPQEPRLTNLTQLIFLFHGCIPPGMFFHITQPLMLRPARGSPAANPS